MFSDLGPAHTVVDADGEPAPSALVDRVAAAADGDADNSGALEVTVADGERHALALDDAVELARCGAADGIYRVTAVRSPTRFVAVPHGDDGARAPLAEAADGGGGAGAGGTATRVKLPETAAWTPLDEALAAPRCERAGAPREARAKRRERAVPKPHDRYVDCDDTKAGATRRETLHACFAALDGDSAGDSAARFAERVAAAARARVGDAEGEAADLELARAFGAARRGALAPVASVAGGVGAQEVLKAVTGVFTPLAPGAFLYYDCLEAIGAPAGGGDAGDDDGADAGDRPRVNSESQRPREGSGSDER